jgi:hypothetical protein
MLLAITYSMKKGNKDSQIGRTKKMQEVENGFGPNNFICNMSLVPTKLHMIFRFVSVCLLVGLFLCFFLSSYTFVFPVSLNHRCTRVENPQGGGGGT